MKISQAHVDTDDIENDFIGTQLALHTAHKIYLATGAYVNANIQSYKYCYWNNLSHIWLA